MWPKICAKLLSAPLILFIFIYLFIYLFIFDTRV
jgi:hypothetical protein